MALREITPRFLIDLQTNMREIVTNEFENAAKDLVWQDIATTINSGAAEERIVAPIEAGSIDYDVAEGYLRFQDLVSASITFEPKFASAALKIPRSQFEDSNLGERRAAQWAKAQAALAAYHPQEAVFNAIKDGDNLTCQWDGKKLFATDHLVNAGRPELGTFSNRTVCNLTDSVTLDQRLKNLSDLKRKIRAIKAANGKTPRRLRMKTIYAPPAMETSLAMLLNSSFFGLPVGSAAASADVSPVSRSFGLNVVIVDELDSAFGGSDTTCYLVIENDMTSELGPLVYLERKEFEIIYYDIRENVDLGRTQEFEWHQRARNAVHPGLPQFIFKLVAA
jgi:phage major head subunit gpT-like protein